MSPGPAPSRICWCGCGSETARGSFFLPGHDRAAEAAVIKVVYGGIPQFLLEHGYSLPRCQESSQGFGQLATRSREDSPTLTG